MEAQGRGLAEPSKGSGELDKGWRKAKAVLALVKASQGFATLRDMISEDAMIDSSRLALSSALGEGAFAHVALGTLDGKRQVAIKSLKPELLNSPEEVTLFLAENEVLRKVKHRNIIELIGMGGAKGEDGNLVELFIVQEYCPGGSLRDLVFQQMISPRRLLYSHKDALRWACGLAKALSYLHRANPKVIHRDLKLDNVLLNQKDTEKAESKLADFGLAKLVDMRRQRSFSTLDPDMARMMSQPPETWKDIRRPSAKLAATLETLQSGNAQHKPSAVHDMTGEAGSYAYMAPEVLRSDKYDESADIFSYGMLLYNLFYRVIPSVLVMDQGGGTSDMLYYAMEVANGFRPQLNDRKVAPEINALINDCWNGVPEMRPTAADVVTRLQGISLEDAKAPESGKTACGCCTLM